VELEEFAEVDGTSVVGFEERTYLRFYVEYII
jgi:hypothetical protein